MRVVFEFKYTPRLIREGVRIVVLAAGLDTATFKLGEEEDINSGTLTLEGSEAAIEAACTLISGEPVYNLKFKRLSV